MGKAIRVRFHLGKGEHYQHWQVTHSDGSVEYIDPRWQLTLVGCRLRNHRSVATRIKSGENKRVCAWVECQTLIVTKGGPYERPNFDGHLRYNPRLAPHWTNNWGHDLDNAQFERLVSTGRQLYATPNFAA